MYGFVLWLQCHFLSSCEIGRKTFTLSWCVSFEFKQTSNISLWCIEDPVCTVCRNGSTFSCWVLDNLNSFYCGLFFPPVSGVIPPLSITSEINKAETLEDKKYAQRCFLWGVQWVWEAMMSLQKNLGGLGSTILVFWVSPKPHKIIKIALEVTKMKRKTRKWYKT